MRVTIFSFVLILFDYLMYNYLILCYAHKEVHTEEYKAREIRYICLQLKHLDKLIIKRTK